MPLSYHRPRRPQPAQVLRRSLDRARDLDGLYERLVLVEHAHLVGDVDAVELVAGGAA